MKQIVNGGIVLNFDNYMQSNSQNKDKEFINFIKKIETNINKGHF